MCRVDEVGVVPGPTQNVNCYRIEFVEWSDWLRIIGCPNNCYGPFAGAIWFPRKATAQWPILSIYVSCGLVCAFQPCIWKLCLGRTFIPHLSRIHVNIILYALCYF